MLFANLRPLLDIVNPQLPAFQNVEWSDQGEVRGVASCLMGNGCFLLEKGGFFLRILSLLALLEIGFGRVLGSFTDWLRRFLKVMTCFYQSGRFFRLLEEGLRQSEAPIGILHAPIATLHSPIGILHSPIATLHSPIGILHAPIAILHSHIGILHARIATNVANSGVNEFPAEINEGACGLYDCRIRFYERPSASTPRLFPMKPLQIGST